MDASPKRQLEERIAEEVQTMLMEGDRLYLQGLSRTALIEAVENELRFLGLYSHDDRETPVAIHEILEKHLDQWCEYYLWQRENPIVNEKQLTPDIKVDTAESPWLQTISSTGVGIPMTEATYYIGFMPPIDRPRIFNSPPE